MEKKSNLQNVNSWNIKNKTYQPIKTMQKISKSGKKSVQEPRAMCLGTECMGNTCGYNCGVIEDRFMRTKGNIIKIQRKVVSNIKKRAA